MEFTSKQLFYPGFLYDTIVKHISILKEKIVCEYLQSVDNTGIKMTENRLYTENCVKLGLEHIHEKCGNPRERRT